MPEAQASSIFDQVDKFAGYGFNKSHAAAYALVCYQTAYLKANHPVEFFAASMTLDMGNADKIGNFRRELERLQMALAQNFITPAVKKNGFRRHRGRQDGEVDRAAEGLDRPQGRTEALARVRQPVLGRCRRSQGGLIPDRVRP